MEDLSNEHNHDHEQLSTSSASSMMELEREDTVCINPGTQDSNEPPTDALDRDNYGVLGSSRSMEDMQRSGNSVVTTLQPPPPPAPSGQPRPPPALSGQTFTATQGNATTPQQSTDSAKILPQGVSSSSAPTAGNTNTIPLHSQHSDDRTANSTNSGSVYVPASSQTTRPQSFLNFTPSQHSQLQASPSSIPPPPSIYSSVQCPLRTNSTESNTSHTSCNSDGRVSNETTPFSGTPSSPMVGLAMYTASQTSLQHDSGLPLNRSAYTAVGCSQEDIQRPRQCTQQPAVGQMSGNTNSSASAVGYTSTNSSTASTPHQQYGSAMGYTGGTNSTTQQQYPGNPLSLGASPGMASHNGLIHYNSQHSNESTGSGPSSIPDNSISAHTFHSQPTRRQSLTMSYNISAPFVHNQTTDPNCYNTAGQPQALNRMDSNTSQNSGAGVSTPTDTSTPSFFPSTNQVSIYPPSHVPLSAPQNATNT